jgi:hypothetical protein
MNEECCCIGWGDPPEWITIRHHKARKHHTCSECGQPIAPGDTYEYVFGVWEGETSVFKTCALCDKIRQDYFPCGFHYGGLADELMECYEVRL